MLLIVKISTFCQRNKYIIFSRKYWDLVKNLTSKWRSMVQEYFVYWCTICQDLLRLHIIQNPLYIRYSQKLLIVDLTEKM